MAMLLIRSLRIWRGLPNAQVLLWWWHESKNKNLLLPALHSFLLLVSGQKVSKAWTPARVENSAHRPHHPFVALTKYSLTSQEVLFFLSLILIHQLCYPAMQWTASLSSSWCLLAGRSIYNLCFPWTWRKTQGTCCPARSYFQLF